MSQEAVILEHFFPKELLDHFELVSSKIQVKDEGEVLEIAFTEFNELPEGYCKKEYEAKDFVERRVRDFPIRGRGVVLKIRRRRWRHKQTKATLSRDLSFIAEGARFTQEVAAFFKELR